jgi:Flp pilus assembly protein TadG
MIMAIFDFGRAIYQYNGASQAAREIARVASVYPGTTFGTSPEITAVINVQKRLVPYLGNPTITCVDISGATVTGTCSSIDGESVKVVISAPYSPVTPLLGLTGIWNMTSSSSAIIQ